MKIINRTGNENIKEEFTKRYGSFSISEMKRRISIDGFLILTIDNMDGSLSKWRIRISATRNSFTILNAIHW